MENKQAKFEGWAIVEMMGHQREIGYVTTKAYGVAVLFRVDVPNMPETEFILKRPEYGDNGDGGSSYLPAGTKLKRSELPARSRLVSPAAVYAINPCTEETARAAIMSGTPRKLICLELPKNQLALEPKPADAPTFRCCGNDVTDGHVEDCPRGDAEEFEEQSADGV